MKKFGHYVARTIDVLAIMVLLAYGAVLVGIMFSPYSYIELGVYHNAEFYWLLTGCVIWIGVHNMTKYMCSLVKFVGNLKRIVKIYKNSSEVESEEKKIGF